MKRQEQETSQGSKGNWPAHVARALADLLIDVAESVLPAKPTMAATKRALKKRRGESLSRKGT